jgi:hypothetical protein
VFKAVFYPLILWFFYFFIFFFSSSLGSSLFFSFYPLTYPSWIPSRFRGVKEGNKIGFKGGEHFKGTSCPFKSKKLFKIFLEFEGEPVVLLASLSCWVLPFKIACVVGGTGFNLLFFSRFWESQFFLRQKSGINDVFFLISLFKG